MEDRSQMMGYVNREGKGRGKKLERVKDVEEKGKRRGWREKG